MNAALQSVGVSDLASFGDSTGKLDLNAVQETTAAAE
jgi:hypothetical protein